MGPSDLSKVASLLPREELDRGGQCRKKQGGRPEEAGGGAGTRHRHRQQSSGCRHKHECPPAGHKQPSYKQDDGHVTDCQTTGGQGCGVAWARVSSEVPILCLVDSETPW
eukprot:scaffold66_cov233-Pinguiococcus_pyrenoidosus.AAC.1